MKHLLEKFDRPAADGIDVLFGSLTREAAPEAAQPMRERGVHVPVRGPGLLSGALKRTGGSLVSSLGVELLAVALLLVVGAGAWFIVSPEGSEAPDSPAERAEAAAPSPTAAAPAPPTAAPTASPTAAATSTRVAATTATATPTRVAATTATATASTEPAASPTPASYYEIASGSGVKVRKSCDNSQIDSLPKQGIKEGAVVEFVEEGSGDCAGWKLVRERTGLQRESWVKGRYLKEYDGSSPAATSVARAASTEAPAAPTCPAGNET